MSASSVAIFRDDTACDVRDEYVDHLRDGPCGKQATSQMIADWSDELADADVAYWVEECEWFPKKGFRLPRKKAVRA